MSRLQFEFFATDIGVDVSDDTTLTDQVAAGRELGAVIFDSIFITDYVSPGGEILEPSVYTWVVVFLG